MTAFSNVPPRIESLLAETAVNLCDLNVVCLAWLWDNGRRLICGSRRRVSGRGL